MIFCVSFVKFVAFLGQRGYSRVGETGDVMTVIEMERVCDLIGLRPPDLDQFWGD